MYVKASLLIATALLCGTLQHARTDPVFASALRDASHMP